MGIIEWIMGAVVLTWVIGAVHGLYLEGTRWGRHPAWLWGVTCLTLNLAILSTAVLALASPLWLGWGGVALALAWNSFLVVKGYKWLSRLDQSTRRASPRGRAMSAHPRE